MKQRDVKHALIAGYRRASGRAPDPHVLIAHRYRFTRCSLRPRNQCNFESYSVKYPCKDRFGPSPRDRREKSRREPATRRERKKEARCQIEKGVLFIMVLSVTPSPADVITEASQLAKELTSFHKELAALNRKKPWPVSRSATCKARPLRGTERRHHRGAN
jgi:hypothetical protein